MSEFLGFMGWVVVIFIIFVLVVGFNRQMIEKHRLRDEMMAAKRQPKKQKIKKIMEKNYENAN